MPPGWSHDRSGHPKAGFGACLHGTEKYIPCEPLSKVTPPTLPHQVDKTWAKSFFSCRPPKTRQFGCPDHFKSRWLLLGSNFSYRTTACPTRYLKHPFSGFVWLPKPPETRLWGRRRRVSDARGLVRVRGVSVWRWVAATCLWCGYLRWFRLSSVISQSRDPTASFRLHSPCPRGCQHGKG